MKPILKLAAAAALSAGALALSTASASAYIVCNGDGDCWHVSDQYTYPTDSRIVVHEDAWKFDDAARYRWREHTGRGYWRGDVWVGF